ncbi:MAG: hypothetical protein KDA92_23260 [Planctomycetales bacterium]|nr:hypothetical protein [Planctomycetales bacterium]
MPKVIQRPIAEPTTQRRVKPSRVSPGGAKPFTLQQELELFGTWVGDPIWVPPKDASRSMAETMVRDSGFFASRDERWQTVLDEHRDNFTQVREFDLQQASIRLPQGRFFVTVTEQADFDKITDTVPRCVQTRLDEFLDSSHMKRGANVYYLKPLCIEVGNELILTTREDLTAAIEEIEEEVFAEYRQLACYRRPVQAMAAAANLGLAIPRAFVNFFAQRRQKSLDMYHAQLEFKRRKLALRAAKTHRKLRTSGCTFDEMLELTTPLKEVDVIDQYCLQNELSRARRHELLETAAGNVPWFVTLSLTVTYVATLLLSSTAPIAVCDPAFVAELPEAPGKLLKIGHFDEVGGVMHVEI